MRPPPVPTPTPIDSPGDCYAVKSDVSSGMRTGDSVGSTDLKSSCIFYSGENLTGTAYEVWNQECDTPSFSYKLPESVKSATCGPFVSGKDTLTING